MNVSILYGYWIHFYYKICEGVLLWSLLSVCVCVCVCVCVSVCHFVNTIDDDEYEFGKFHFLCMDNLYTVWAYILFFPLMCSTCVS